MEVGIYVIKRNKDFFDVGKEYTYMSFLLTGEDDSEPIKNTLYSLASYGLPMDAVELYKVGYFYTEDGSIELTSVSDGEEVREVYDDHFTYAKIYVDMKPYQKTYEYFVSEIERLSKAEIPVELKEEVKRVNGKKELIPDDV